MHAVFQPFGGADGGAQGGQIDWIGIDVMVQRLLILLIVAVGNSEMNKHIYENFLHISIPDDIASRQYL